MLYSCPGHLPGCVLGLAFEDPWVARLPGDIFMVCFCFSSRFCKLSAMDSRSGRNLFCSDNAGFGDRLVHAALVSLAFGIEWACCFALPLCFGTAKNLCQYEASGAGLVVFFRTVFLLSNFHHHSAVSVSELTHRPRMPLGQYLGLCSFLVQLSWFQVKLMSVAVPRSSVFSTYFSTHMWRHFSVDASRLACSSISR